MKRGIRRHFGVPGGRGPFTWAGVFLVLSMGAGCSVITSEDYACSSNQECRAALGWGRVCGDSGLCEFAAPEPRCDQTIPSDLLDNPAAYRDTIVLGSVYERDDFPKEVKSIALAINQVNEDGGLDGRHFGLIQCTISEDADIDQLSEDDAAGAMSTWLADEIGVPAIIGPATSAHTSIVFQAVEDYGTLVISASATSPALTTLDGLSHSDDAPGLLWRTVPPDSLQGQAIAQSISDGGTDDASLPMVAVLYRDDSYGEGLALAFVDAYAGAYELKAFSTNNGRDETIVEAGENAYDAVIFISSDRSDIIGFLNAAAGLDGYVKDDEEDEDYRDIFLADGAYDTSILDETRDEASILYPQIRGTRPSVPEGTVYNQFLASYSAAYGEDASTGGFTAHAYDASWLVIYGSAWSYFHEGETISGTGIASGLRHVSKGDEINIVPTSWTSVIANFQEDQSIDVIGASGDLDYDASTEETTAPIDIWKISSDGKTFEVVDTLYF